MTKEVYESGSRADASKGNEWQQAADVVIARSQHAPGLGLYFVEAEGGVYGDNTIDNSTALANAMAAAIAGHGSLYVSYGNLRYTTTPPDIATNGFTITGDAANGDLRARLEPDGCDGLHIAAGVSDFRMSEVEVVAATPYSTTTNSLTGIRVDGTSAAHCQKFKFRNVFCNGFMNGWTVRYLWSSLWDSCDTLNGLCGIVAYGLSVNNEVRGGLVNVAGAGSVAGSRCIALLGYESDTDSTPVASEGWIIKPLLADGAEVAVEIAGNAHIEVGGILDHCGMHGVLIRDNGVNFGGNCDIHPTYVAMNTAAGVAAIRNANTIANPTLKRTRVHDTLLTVYTGATCTYGINQSGSNGLMIAKGNSAKGFSTADFFAQSAGNIVDTNDFQSAVTNNVSGASASCLTCVIGFNGHVWVPGSAAGGPFAYTVQGNRKIAPWFGPPTIGTWAVSDEIPNLAATSGQPIGWICTAAGTPGTWAALPSLA